MEEIKGGWRVGNLYERNEGGIEWRHDLSKGFGIFHYNKEIIKDEVKTFYVKFDRQYIRARALPFLKAMPIW